MNKCAPLEIYEFVPGQFPRGQERSPQVCYVERYLDQLHARTVVEEPNYFDKDYLAEVLAYYGSSASGYPNTCRRVHCFREKFDRALLSAAAGGDAIATEKLQEAYLGFCVIRPIDHAPFGRTVLRWFEDLQPRRSRVTTPCRKYKVHLAGIVLSIDGLAWQQQDSAVGACATIALWTCLHSSAFEGLHEVPTTADITRSAHRSASLGSRVFPSSGLTLEQLCEVIKEYGLTPSQVLGDLQYGEQMSRAVFSQSCCSLIRSGFPVIVLGALQQEPVEGHAVCVLGFRPPPLAAIPTGGLVHVDSSVECIYVHNDNIGPNVRMVLSAGTHGGASSLEYSAPRSVSTILPDTTIDASAIMPRFLVAAMPEEIRLTPRGLTRLGELLCNDVNRCILLATRSGELGLAFQTRYVRLCDYLTDLLDKTIGTNRVVESRVRLSLQEDVRPMSLHLGLVRVAISGSVVLDVLFDTTENDHNAKAFAHVVFETALVPISSAMRQAGSNIGTFVDATLVDPSQSVNDVS